MTMLEKAARAACRDDYLRMPQFRKPGAELALDCAVDDDWRPYVSTARAVLMSVRDVAEPVSWRALERLDGDACCFEFTYTRSREIHTAMIDAILNEDPTA